MNATWYDVLGVEPTASADAIRAAWKQAIADLEPTDRRFRACNQAAETLLDPDRRAAYDAELAAASTADAEPAAEAEAGDEEQPVEQPPATIEPPAVQPGPARPSAAFVVPTWLLSALAAATGAVLILAAIVWFVIEEETDVEASVAEARSAAEDALPKLINYSYKTAERDRDQALRLTTGDANDEMRELWDDALMPNIVEAKASTSSTFVTSGVVRVSSDGDQVQVVVVMDVQSQNAAVTNNQRLPFTVTMSETDGVWLVSEFKDSNAGSQGQTERPSESPTPTGQSD